jgi:hypothetical protein
MINKYSDTFILDKIEIIFLQNRLLSTLRMNERYAAANKNKTRTTNLPKDSCIFIGLLL